MFSGSSSGTGFNTSSVYTWSSGNANPNKDIVVASPPEDSISSLAWSPTGLFLCAGSWNNTVSFVVKNAISQCRLVTVISL